METLAAARPGSGSKSAPALIDKWIYVGTAILLLAIILFGFVPDSLEKLEAVRSGERPPFPLILHVHAVVTGAWALLLLAQTVLMATGDVSRHRLLGRAAFVLAPAFVLSAIILVPAIRMQGAQAILHAPPEAIAGLKARFATGLDMLLIQTRSVCGFVLMVAIGLWARTKNSGLHKRMMILSLVPMLGAATTRIPWLASTMPASPMSIIMWPLVAMALLFFWDLYRQRRIHPAYLILLAYAAATAIPVLALWGTPGWRDAALGILGLPAVLP